MMVNFFRGFLSLPFITHCSSASGLVRMMMISLGGLQNVMFFPCFICSSTANVCMDSMASGGISFSLFATISLAESDRISSMVTCRRESGRGVPSMTHKVCACVLRVVSTVRIIQIRVLFRFSSIIIFLFVKTIYMHKAG